MENGESLNLVPRGINSLQRFSTASPAERGSPVCTSSRCVPFGGCFAILAMNMARALLAIETTNSGKRVAVIENSSLRNVEP